MTKDTPRNANSFTPHFNTVTFGKRSIRYFGPLCSKLSREDKTRPNIVSFKINIRNIRDKDLEACRQYAIVSMLSK